MYFEVFRERKLIKRGNHILGGLRWSNELMYTPSTSIQLPIEYREFFRGREEIKIFVNDKVFWGEVLGIEEDKDREVINLDIEHIIHEWTYRQISVNNAVKDGQINLIFKGSVIEKHDDISVSANPFDLYIPDVYTLTDEDWIRRAGAVAWYYNGDDDPITMVDASAVKRKPDAYDVIFGVVEGGTVTVTCTVKQLRGTRTGSKKYDDGTEVTVCAVPFEMTTDEVGRLSFDDYKKRAYAYAWDENGDDLPVDGYDASEIRGAVGEYDLEFTSGEAKVRITVTVLEAGADINPVVPRYKDRITDPSVIDELVDIYNEMNFAYPGWVMNYSEKAKKQIIDYVYSRQNKLEALTKTMELTEDLFWRVRFVNQRVIDVSEFGEEKRWIVSHKPSGPNNIRIIDEPTVRHDFDNVINMATVYSEKSDSGMSSMTLREIYEDLELQEEGFPVVIVRANVNNERDYTKYSIQYPTLAPNNWLEYAVIDEESVALEGGILIEGTFAFNDLSPFEIERDEDGFEIEVSDEDRIKAAQTAYSAAIRKLKLSRRTFEITLTTEELPADIAPGDKVRFVYDNSLYILEECSSYMKKVLSYDDWFYITSIDYDIDPTGAEVDTITLEKYLKIDRETSNE